MLYTTATYKLTYCDPLLISHVNVYEPNEATLKFENDVDVKDNVPPLLLYHVPVSDDGNVQLPSAK
jgi:hypothetical protein